MGFPSSAKTFFNFVVNNRNLFNLRLYLEVLTKSTSIEITNVSNHGHIGAWEVLFKRESVEIPRKLICHESWIMNYQSEVMGVQLSWKAWL